MNSNDQLIATAVVAQSVQAGLQALAARLDPLIQDRLKEYLGTLEWTAILAELDKAKGHAPKVYSTRDLQCQLRILTEQLGGLGYPFSGPGRVVSVLGGELRIVRNRWAHNDQFSALDGWRAHDFATRLLEHLGDAEGAQAAANVRNSLLPAVLEESGFAPNTVEVAASESGSSAKGAAASGEETAVPFEQGANGDPEDAIEPDAEVLDRGDTAGTPVIGRGRLAFQPWTPVIAGDVAVLDSLPRKVAKEKVRAVAAEIVDFEGPIHMDRLVQLVALSFDVRRLHSARGQKIVRQVRAAGYLVDKAKFVWPEGVDPAIWTEFRPNAGSVERPFHYVSTVEIRNAALFLQRESRGAVSRAELERRVLQTFGRRRRTKQIVAHLDAALEGLNAE